MRVVGTGRPPKQKIESSKARCGELFWPGLRGQTHFIYEDRVKTLPYVAPQVRDVRSVAETSRPTP